MVKIHTGGIAHERKPSRCDSCADGTVRKEKDVASPHGDFSFTFKDLCLEVKIMSTNKITVRKIAVTGIMSAVAAVLMMLEFPVPLVPSFLKFDFSDLPAFITAFSLGPVWGVVVELIKNVVHLPFSGTSGVGEFANFIIGAMLVFPAGLVYKFKKDRAGALIGSVVGAVFAAAVSVPVNYFITYPFYAHFMPMESIINAYKAILPAADSLIKALLIFNAPFTFVKGAICAIITFVVYKKLSPIIKGTNR